MAMCDEVPRTYAHPLPPPGYLSRFAEVSYTKKELPHWECSCVAAFITLRLGDSLPEDRLGPWRKMLDEWKAAHPEPWDRETEMEYARLYRGEIEKWLDQGFGAAVFSDPVNRAVVEEALHYYDGKRYALYSFVVMPNHVHLLMMPTDGNTIASIMRLFKHYVSTKLAAVQSWEGKFWQNEYWDALIRNERHFMAVRRYIKSNSPAIAYDAYER